MGDDVASSQECSGGTTDPVVAPAPSQTTTWSGKTELLTVPGTNKIMLTVQRPLMRAVFQEAFDRTCVALVFRNAFPNVYDTIEMINNNLMTAAEANPRGGNIFNRLVIDGDYTTKMSHLVSIEISNREILTLFSASCAHSSFPCGGKGSLCSDHTGQVPGHPIKFVCYSPR